MNLCDRIKMNYAMRVSLQCIHCRFFIPYVQCIWELNLDEKMICDRQELRQAGEP
jgi:hypothetical protein